MKTKFNLLALAVLALLSTISSQPSTCLAQGTAFTYQGRLQNNGNQANGNYDLQFSLFDAVTNGSQVGVTVTNLAVGVTNGLFTTALDFGSGIFTGQALWLQIGVETNGGGGNFTILGALQPLTPTPYAVYSANSASASTALGVANGSITGASIGSGQVVKSLNGLMDAVTLAAGTNITLTPSGNTLTISSTGSNGSGSSSNAWSLTGNAGTTAGVNFLGTRDNEPLELWVNGSRAMRLEPGVSGDAAPNVIGGSSANFVASGIVAATISGGGAVSYKGIYYGSLSNSVTADFGTVGGGAFNTSSGLVATVGGGQANEAGGDHATVGGGKFNTATASESYATVGGGESNSVSGNYSTVGGGGENIASGSYGATTVGGGVVNTASGDYSTVGGGSLNTASGYVSTVGGGGYNGASTNFATVGGGIFNQATGPGSFVGGGGYDGISSASGNMASGPASTVAGGLGNSASGFYAMVGGGVSNTASGPGASVGGGGYDGTYFSGNVALGGASTVAGGLDNSAGSAYATVGGGTGNNAGGSGATVGGGESNTAVDLGTVGGGYGNSAGNTAVVGGGYGNTASGPGAFVGGGGYDGYNYSGNMASGAASTVGGGLENTASAYGTVGGGHTNTASGDYSTVCGGDGNTASSYYSTVGGGSANTASNFWSTVGGGVGNTANGLYSTVPGGWVNTASGDYSFAAGNQANAANQGAFVWADSQNAYFSSTANDQFSIRAQGGVRLDNSTSMAFGSQPREMLQLYRDPTATYIYGIGVQTATFYTRTGTNGGFAWYQGGLYNGNQNNAGGGKTMMTLGNTGNLTIAGTLAQNSNRNIKSGFQPVDARLVLEKIAAMAVTRWHYTNDAATPHIGPMAQDFYAAFGLGEDDKHITTVDEGGVALAAIQGLNQKLNEKDATIREQGTEIQELKQSMAELKQIMQALAEKK